MNKKWTEKILGLGLILAAGLIFGAMLQAEETVVCPVTGEKVLKSEAPARLDYQGKTYYFCCEACREAFQKDPGKYIGKRADGGEMPCRQNRAAGHGAAGHGEKTRAGMMKTARGHEAGHGRMAGPAAGKNVDPVCGMEMETSQAGFEAEYRDRTYSFCSETCRDRFLADPEKYLPGDAVVKCPVLGTEFKKSEAAASSVFQDRTYHFCCSGCKKEFDRNPKKYARGK